MQRIPEKIKLWQVTSSSAQVMKSCILLKSPMYWSPLFLLHLATCSFQVPYFDLGEDKTWVWFQTTIWASFFSRPTSSEVWGVQMPHPMAGIFDGCSGHSCGWLGVAGKWLRCCQRQDAKSYNLPTSSWHIKITMAGWQTAGLPQPLLAPPNFKHGVAVNFVRKMKQWSFHVLYISCKYVFALLFGVCPRTNAGLC